MVGPGSDTLDAELDWLVLAMVIDPAARSVLGRAFDDHAIALMDRTREVLVPPQREWIRKVTKLDHTDAVVSHVRHILTLIDRPSSPPSPKSAPRLFASPDAMLEFLREPGRTEVTTRGLRKARLPTGSYAPLFDEVLRAAGFDMIVIEAPSPAELDRCEAQGFQLVSSTVRYMTHARSEEAFLADLGSKNRSRARNMLAKSRELEVVTSPLDEAIYAEWYAIYQTEILSKPGAWQVYTPEFVAEETAHGTLEQWWTVMFRDPTTHELAGGVIASDYPERGFFSISGAAYKQSFKHLDLSIRSFMICIELAQSRGWPLLSYGSDWNLYGYDQAIGLLNYKLSVAVTPYPECELELRKVLVESKFAEITTADGKRPGYFWFGVRPQSKLWQTYRAARADGRDPPAEELLGDHYFARDCLAPHETLFGHHVCSDPAVQIRTPHGIDMVRRPLR